MAKYITKRTEIAKAINFGKYPVLRLDVTNKLGYDENDEHGFCEGDKVRVAFQTKNYGELYTHGNIYREDGKIAISGNATCISSSFGYHDVIEMAEWANTPLIHAGQEVVVVLYNPEIKACIVQLMKVSDRIDPHCMTVAVLEEIDEEE